MRSAFLLALPLCLASCGLTGSKGPEGPPDVVATEVIAALDAGNVDEAERALTDAGRSVQKNVLEAMRAVDDARLNVEKAKSDYSVAIIELERLKGSL